MLRTGDFGGRLDVSISVAYFTAVAIAFACRCNDSDLTGLEGVLLAPECSHGGSVSTRDLLDEKATSVTVENKQFARHELNLRYAADIQASIPADQ